MSQLTYAIFHKTPYRSQYCPRRLNFLRLPSTRAPISAVPALPSVKAGELQNRFNRVGTLGRPDALRLLLAVAGQSPIVDIGICVLVIGAVTAPVLGTMLLARFFRKARNTAAAPHAAATDHFAKMTLMVSMAVAFLVTACFLVALCVELGGAAEFRLLLTFAGRRPLVAVTATVSAATAPVLGTIPLARFIRKARAAASAGGAASPVATARERTPKMLVSLTGAFLLAGYLLVIPFLAARRGPDGATLPALPDAPASSELRSQATASSAAASKLRRRWYRLLPIRRVG